MAAAAIHLEIVTPERRVLEEEVDEVVLPSADGYLGVRPGHTPLLTALGIGELSFVRAGAVRHVAVAEGFAEILPTRVSVLTETAERAAEIDVARAEASRGRAAKALAESLNAEDGAFRRAEVRLQRAASRIAVARRRDEG